MSNKVMGRGDVGCHIVGIEGGVAAWGVKGISGE